MDWKRALGWDETRHGQCSPEERWQRIRYLNLQLLANGLPAVLDENQAEFATLAKGLLDHFLERFKLVKQHRCPIDRRIEAFLGRYFAAAERVGAESGRPPGRERRPEPAESAESAESAASAEPLRLPDATIVLDRHGLARELSLPFGGDRFENEWITSIRVRNGVLHNPIHDRRTTAGTFHVCEGGLPIPGDKQAVPPQTFRALFRLAMQPPEALLVLPFTAERSQPARTFVSLLLRPLVCPEVPGVCPERTMEVRFLVPGGFVSNLDFVESIFGNAGDPFLPENDAGLDVEHWTGHTGCVIVAPHLIFARKRDVGLPHVSAATPRQQRDGMCWESPDELYNDGQAFKLTCRDAAGVIVTLIADNYFGYCKKEIKTQISFAANLLGHVEEEHAGGVLAFPSFNLGEEFQVDSRRYNGRTFADVVRDYGELMHVQLDGYAIDKRFPELIYVPENAFASIARQRIEWTRHGEKASIPLLPGRVYMAPSGYKFRLEKHPAAPTWRLIGTVGEGVCCHKPSTVSGGGKSEISKSLVDYMLYGPFFVNDARRDFERVQEIFDFDFSQRWRDDSPHKPDYLLHASRPILSPRRSLGSVIKLLTPSPDYTDQYNTWLAEIPNHIYAMVLIVKRFQQPGWSGSWRQYFSVDVVNGEPGHELKYRARRLVATYLRVGQDANSWQTFKVRQDFAAAAKVQTEDDISVSLIVPGRQLSGLAANEFDSLSSVKFAVNCEFRLFQRPDDAIHRGLDKQTEADLTRGDNFLSNFEPLKRADVEQMLQSVVDFDAFSPPMQQLLRDFQQSSDQFVVCSAQPRKIGDDVSKNPRYLQSRPDLVRPLDRYLAEQGIRFYRAVPWNAPVLVPVNAVLMGRRNNPPDPAGRYRGLAVYNPLHYQELPELFMDFICSLTGKSPSTTGFGSEGALTKGPFNALRPIVDLNNALVSFILTRLAAFSTPAGHIGLRQQVDHDISLLVPEIWCRMSAEERQPSFLISEGLLEKLEDRQRGGELVPVSRLGYRITFKFIRRFFGRVFDNPSKVFDEVVLQPEKQDEQAFLDGVAYIAEAQQVVARRYIEDGSLADACPPLAALLRIMADGEHHGPTVHSPEFRAQFTPAALLTSDWYAARLQCQQRRDAALWRRHADYVREFMTEANSATAATRLDLHERLRFATNQLDRVQSVSYLDELRGTLGADPSLDQITVKPA